MKCRFAVLLPAFVLAVAITPNHTLAQSGYAVAENGPDYRVWQKTAMENGTNRVHKYVELASGLNFQDPVTGRWKPSSEEIETYPQGAIARQGQYQVIFANNLNSAGTIDLQTPDGKRLRSSIIGLAYDDRSTGKNVLIAQIQSSQGELISSNQVLYPDAFDGVVKADVRYTYRKGGFEQDVILREQPPDPAALGLNPNSTEIDVLTEFTDSPSPSVVENRVKGNALPDQEIGWGVMRLGHGRAFDLGEPWNRPSRVAVRRQWVTAQGRSILVEGVPLKNIQASLAKLPLQASIATKRPLLASATLALPPTPPAQAEPKPMKLASALHSDRGFVLDYNLLNQNQLDFTFASGQTYFISGYFSLGGTTTFEGGTVLKFPEDGSAALNCSGPVVCATTPYSPAVFTSANDDSLEAGEPLPEPLSNHNPAMGWANYLGLGAIELEHCRFYYAGAAISAGNSEVLNDCQFVQCYNGLVVNSAEVNNSLVSGCHIFADNGITCENVSFYDCFAAADGDSYFTNCFFSSIGDLDSVVYGATASGSNNGFYNCDSSVLFGDNVVTGNIGDAGNTTADRLGLFWWTTSGPIEGTSVVDLGYHTPAVDDSGYPISTLVPGVPDYISDSGGNGLPDAWEMQYFGNLNHFASELDPLGNTLLYDCTFVPQFMIQSTNDYVNHTNVVVQLNISGAVPYYLPYYAVVLNGSTATNWVPLVSTNLTLILGTTDGVYVVAVGLRAYLTNATQTWRVHSFTLDREPPVLNITNPATCTLGIPLTQVQGHTIEQLSAFTFDVSNATGVVTGQQGIVMGQVFDTNLWRFTTNYFQCFDIALTPGTNLVSLHATDLAGNTTTSNLLLNLDFSTRTNLPVVSLVFPEAGKNVSGASFTADGLVDDPTASIVAQIVDASGNTNTVNGVVERTGRFWLDNLPLGTGSNILSLTVTDAAGNTTNLTMAVVQSTAALTINAVTDASQLWQPVVDLTGTVSDSGYAVTVNGVAATVNGTSWTAANVPVTPGGVACFTATAMSGGQTQATAKTSPEKPDSVNGSAVIVQSDFQTMHATTDDRSDLWYDEAMQSKARYTEDWYLYDLGQNWEYANGGTASSTYSIDEDQEGQTESGWVVSPHIHWGYFGGWEFLPGDPVPYDYGNQDYRIWTGDTNGMSLNTPLGCEHCNVQSSLDTTSYDWVWITWCWTYQKEHIVHTYTRSAQTTMALLSGGRAIPGRQILHAISGWVKDVIPSLGIEAQPPYRTVWMGDTTLFGRQPNVPNSSVHIGVLGTLHDPVGTLYYVTPAGADPIDVTPTVGGLQFYAWNLSDSPCPLLVSLAPDQGLLVATNPDTYLISYCEGSYVTVSANPPCAINTVLPEQWRMTGGLPYPNDNTKRLVDRGHIGSTIITATAAGSSKSIKVIVYLATIEVDADAGDCLLTQHAWWDIEVAPSDVYDFLKTPSGIDLSPWLGLGGYYGQDNDPDCITVGCDGRFQSGPQPITGTSPQQYYSPTGAYWWSISFGRLINALSYVRNLDLDPGLYQLGSNDCVSESESVISAAGHTTRAGNMTACDFSAWLNLMYVSSPPTIGCN